MKTKAMLVALCLSLSLTASAGSLSSSLGVSVGLTITNLVLAKMDPEAQKSFQASVHLGTLASTGALAAISLVISDGLDYLSSNKKTERLDQVMAELRENDELKDKSDEELAVMIISIADDLE